MSNYNGWTNYATWRVNLEIFDGIDPSDMGWNKNTYDLWVCLKEYAKEVIGLNVPQQGLMYEYALSFIDDVNWLEIAQSMIEAYQDEQEAA